MSGMPGRSGRKTFVPTPEQHRNVKALVALGIPQEEICQLVINPQTGKPLDVKSLRKHFGLEIETAEIKLHALMNNFTVANILGTAPPAGTRAIDNQHARASLLKFFAKTRMGWKEPVVNRQKEPVDGPIEYQDATSVRQTIIDRLERLSQCNRRLDRFWLPVGDWQKSRDWYRRHLGFEVEFEIPDRKTVAMRAGAYLTMFLFESEVLPCPGISFAIPVDDVDAKYEELIAEGIPFIHPPMKVFWGYGAELCDPDGYRFRLWDEKSMKEKDSA